MSTTGDPNSLLIDPDVIKQAQKAYQNAPSKHQVALKQIRKLCSQHNKIGLLQRIQAEVLVKCYESATDVAKKSKYMDDAMKCARIAIELCPNSIEFSSFLGRLFYMSSNDSNGYLEAVEQYGKALKIQIPSDSAQDMLLYEQMQSMFSTYESRIGFLREDITKAMGLCVFKLKELQTDPAIMKEKLESLELKKLDKVKILWYSITSEERRSIIEMNVKDITCFLLLHNKLWENEVVSDAILVYKTSGKWESWNCIFCDEKLVSENMHFAHYALNHIEDTYLKIMKYTGLQIGEIFASTSLWKPFDNSPAAIAVLMKERYDSLYTTVDKKFWSLQVCIDSEREALLNKLRTKLEECQSKNRLLGVYFKILIDRTMAKLRRQFGDWIKDIRLDESHYCFCMLAASEITEVIGLLDEIIDFTEKDYEEAVVEEVEVSSDYNITIQTDTKTDSLCLCLGEAFLSKQSTSGGSYEKSRVEQDNASNTSLDNFVNWICSGSDQDLVHWKVLSDEKRENGKQAYDKYEELISESLKCLDKLQEGLRSDVFPTDIFDSEVADFSSPEPASEKSEKSDSMLSEMDKSILQLGMYLKILAQKVNRHAHLDYHPFLLSILKSYIQEYLEGTLDNNTKKSGAAKGNAGKEGSRKNKATRSSKKKMPVGDRNAGDNGT